MQFLGREAEVLKFGEPDESFEEADVHGKGRKSGRTRMVTRRNGRADLVGYGCFEARNRSGVGWEGSGRLCMCFRLIYSLYKKLKHRNELDVNSITY